MDRKLGDHHSCTRHKPILAREAVLHIFEAVYEFVVEIEDLPDSDPATVKVEQSKSVCLKQLRFNDRSITPVGWLL